MIPANPILGTTLHAVGAMSAALCYTPQQKVKGWSWQTYWLTQAAICLFIAPIVGALITIPELGAVLSEAPKDVMLFTFGLGVVYGIGGISFGLAIKHIGFSLTYAIAIGISCVLGTFSGPMLTGNLADKLAKPGAGFVVMGVAVGVVGTMLCGVAGRFKEKALDNASGEHKAFALVKGLILCLIAGVFSAVYGYAINDAGKPIADVAAGHGAGIWKTNIVYIFANSGAFLTTVIYTLSLAVKQKTLKEFVSVHGAPRSTMVMNYLLAALTGVMWYGQFLFYGIGHVRMGDFEFSSWAIHMIMMILFSSLTGLVLKEWMKCGGRAAFTIALALLVLVGAILVVTYGNWLADQPVVQ